MTDPLTLVITRTFDAPIGLVFDVLTQAEHLRHTVAPYGETVAQCSVDLRVGGEYRYVLIPADAAPCAFFGTFREVVRPTRTAQTWNFDGWPDVEAIESIDLHEDGAQTTMTWSLTFSDQADRDRMGGDGVESNFDHVAAYLRSLT